MSSSRDVRVTAEKISVARDKDGMVYLSVNAGISGWMGGLPFSISVHNEPLTKEELEGLFGANCEAITRKLYLITDTIVGGELLAAIKNLASDSQAEWSQCALACRQVIIKLGTALWQVSSKNYVGSDGKQLDVSRDKEKNRLLAYIDTYSKQVTPSKQYLLKQAGELVRPIYAKGSKGKRHVNRSEVQALLSDTFALVDFLNEVTGLQPLVSSPFSLQGEIDK